MVGVERFELPTLWSQTRCATRLRYTPPMRVGYTVRGPIAILKAASGRYCLSAGPVTVSPGFNP